MSDTQLREVPATKGEVKERDDKYSDVVDNLANVVAGIPARPGKSLMTADQLQARMGSAPKKDRLGGLIKRSPRYKAIRNSLLLLERDLAQATLEDIATDGGREWLERTLTGRLNGIDEDCRNYQKSHTGKKGQAVEALRKDVARFRREIGTVLDDLTGEKFSETPVDLRVDQAMALNRAGIKQTQLKGISVEHCDFAKFNDDTRDGLPTKTAKGAVNTAEFVSYGGVTKVFKEEKPTDISGAQPPMNMGLKPSKDPRYGNRNIASGLLGELLGSSAIPKSRFGISGKKVGLVMDLAPGRPAAKMYQKINNKRSNTLKPRSKAELKALSPKAKASLQRQLMDLEVCDILTGQADRHAGNYMVDTNGDEVTVTGIDNDFAFPSDKTYGDNGIPLVFPKMKSVPNLPTLMSRTIADKILGIDFDRDVMPRLDGLLNDGEIKATRDRLQALQNHVTTLNADGCVVSDWVSWRGPAPNGQMNATEYLLQCGMRKDKKADSLFARDFGQAFRSA